MPQTKSPLCRLHPDCHMPPDVDVGERFDPDALAERLRPLGVESFVVFAKCSYGHAYYPTRIGTPHPRLKRDLVGTAIEGFRRHGIDVPVYMNVLLDRQAALQHPQWAVRPSGGTNAVADDAIGLRRVCPNSDYGDRLLYPMAAEVVTRYDVEELLMDTNPDFEVCHCDGCTKGFGRPLPSGPRDPSWLDYVRWYAQGYDRFFNRAVSAIHAANPRVKIIFNSRWGTDEPDAPAPYISALCQDLWASGLIATRYCRYFAGTGLPFEYMTGRFLHGLGDWNNNTQESLRNTAASTIANGGRFYLIDRLLPDGTLQEDSYRAIGSVFPFVQKRREWVEGWRHVPELAILTSHASVVGRRFERFPNASDRRERLKPADGACRLFAEHGRHFTTLGEHTARKRLKEFRCLVAPELEVLAPETVRAIEAWVHKGGKLLLSQPTWADMPDHFAYRLAGVRCQGLTEYNYGYFGTETPIHIRGRFALVKAEECREVHAYVLPMEAGGGARRLGLGFAPATHTSEYSSVTRRSLGKGEVIYLAGPAFGAYWDNQCPHLARMILGLVDDLLPEPTVRIETPAQVEVSLLRKKDDLVIHLVNHAGRERIGGWVFSVTEYIPEIRESVLRVRVGKRRPKILHVPGKTVVRYTVDNGYAVLRCPPLHEMESLLVPGYFG